jgi:hypothetical protein
MLLYTIQIIRFSARLRNLILKNIILLNIDYLFSFSNLCSAFCSFSGTGCSLGRVMNYLKILL